MNRLIPAVLVVLPALGACGSLFANREPATTVYTLRAAAVEPAAGRVAATLLVSRPRARPGLDSTRIAVTLPGHRLDRYAQAAWSAPLPDLVGDLLLEGLRGGGAFAAVLPESSPFRGRYLLQSEVVDFEAEYASPGSAPTVRVRLAAELGLAGERRVLAALTAEAAVPAAADRQREVVAAFDAAARQAVQQLVAAVDAAALAAEPAPPAAPPPAATP